MAAGDDTGARALSREYGEPDRCPHCGTVTSVEPAGALRFRCQVCGGPRVVVDARDVTRSGHEGRALDTAQRERIRVAAWRLGAALTAGFGLLSFAVALIVSFIVSPGALGSGVMLGLGAMPLILSALAWRRANQHRAARDEALDEAWTTVARDIVEQHDQELTASDLAAIMHRPVEEAERLLARLDVDDIVRSRVTDAGEIVYSTGVPAARLRVGDEVDDATAEAEADLEALGVDASATNPSSAKSANRNP